MTRISGTACLTLTHFAAARAVACIATAAIALVSLPLVPKVLAQPQTDCEIVLDLRSGNTTDLAEQNFGCLLVRFDQLQRENNELRDQVRNLQQENYIAHQRIGMLQQELDPLQRVLRDAVIAFNRSERGGGACPDNWSLFKPVGGRMIVGAGQHNNTDMNGKEIATYAAYSDNPKNAVGGSETHVLRRDEMSAFVEDIRVVRDDHGSGPGTLDVVVDVSPVKKRGDASPHNNMPPFVALYFCQYDGGQP